MKKVLALTLVAVLLAGCGAASVKTGLGHDISIGKSADATAEKAGLAQVDAIMAAVTVDSAGKILGVTIDNAQVKVNFDTAGKVTTDKASKPKTKVELGNDYGMKKSSGIGKEWFEQIADLEKWMVGKTAAQINAMKTVKKDDSHPSVPDEADLKSKVTVSVEGYQAAVTEAIANAK